MYHAVKIISLATLYPIANAVFTLYFEQSVVQFGYLSLYGYNPFILAFID